ncbi:alpha/beta fold hydrolase [Paenibacillus enshidis]|uniref:Alpha/beta fold hydrolase n=1 Tax=Paenibacillus enshidis TaxID=1458439 RepID=A0ABV5AZ77_9BACL
MNIFDPSDIANMGWCDSYSIPSNNMSIVTWNATSGTALYWGHNMTRVIPELKESQCAPVATNRFIGFFIERVDEFQLQFWDLKKQQLITPDNSIFPSPYEIITYNEEYYLGILNNGEGKQELSLIHFRNEEEAIRIVKLVESQTIEELKPDISVRGQILMKRRCSNGSGNIICDYVLFDPETQTEMVIFEGSPTKIPMGGRWSPDGNKIVCLLRTTQGLIAEIVDVATGEKQSIADISLRELPVWHPDGERLLLTLDKWPTSSFMFYHIGMNEVQPLPMTFESMMVAPTWFEKTLYFLGISPNSPASLFSWKEGDEIPIQITPPQENINLGMPEVVDIDSKRGYLIPCLIYAPQKTTDKTILMLHGGPSGSWWANWSPVVLSFISKGFNVVLVNPRGSSIRNRNLPPVQPARYGVDDVADVKDCIDYLIRNGLAVKGKIGIYGHSYGGYLGFATMQSVSEVIGAVVITSGYIHPAVLLQSKDKLVRRFANYAFSPDVLTQPLDHIPSPQPVLQVHGENDLQLRIEDAENLHQLLERKNNTEHRFIRLSDENHAYRKKHNIIHWITEACTFFTRHL